MDSFTQKLLRENFNRVDIDPNFRILADQTESDLLKQEVFDDLVEQYLSEQSEIKEVAKIDKKAFEKLVKIFQEIGILRASRAWFTRFTTLLQQQKVLKIG